MTHLHSSRQNHGTLFRTHPKTIGLAVALALMILVEFFFMGVIYVSHYVINRPENLSDFAFHPLITDKITRKGFASWNEFHPVFGYVNIINVSNDCGYTTDRYGFTHNGDSQRDFTTATFKVFVLGGSTVAGHGSSCNDATIPGQLQQLIAAKYSGIEVVNAGVAGYFSPTEFAKVVNEIVYFKPDLVLTFSGVNDERHQPLQSFLGRPHAYFLSDYHRYIQRQIDESGTFTWSIKHLLFSLLELSNRTYTSFVIRKFSSALRTTFSVKSGSAVTDTLVNNTIEIYGKSEEWNGDEEIADNGFQAEYDQNVEYFFKYIQMTQFLLRALSIEHIFFLQPRLGVESRRLSPNEMFALKIASRAVFKRDGHDYVKRARYFWRRVDELFPARGIRYISLVNIFPDEVEVYVDPFHYNDLGNRIVAENILATLEAEKLIPSKLLKHPSRTG